MAAITRTIKSNSTRPIETLLWIYCYVLASSGVITQPGSQQTCTFKGEESANATESSACSDRAHSDPAPPALMNQATTCSTPRAPRPDVGAARGQRRAA